MRAYSREDYVVITRIVFSVLALGLAFSAFAVDLTDAQQAQMEQRIKPVGENCMVGDSSCGIAVTAASGEPRSGEEVYKAACLACHATGAAGAPIYADAAAWKDRIAKGADALNNSALKGIAGTPMIAKGGCVSCSEEEVLAAVDYMVAGSQ